MSAATIAAALGGVYRSGQWWRCVCPVHGSKSASLALRDGARGLIAKCWGPCTPGQVLAELRRRGLYSDEPDAAAPPDPDRERCQAEAEAAERARKIALARDMWESSWPAAGTIAEAYLRARLPGLGEIPETIRYLPPRAYYARHPASGWGWPVLIARIDHVAHGSVAVARLWLSPDGGGRKASVKPERKFTGPVGGAAVRLAPAGEALVVGEGIESTLAAMILMRRPGWAALSAGGIQALVLPDEARGIVIACDRDPSGVGERKARAAACRWVHEGRRVRLVIPDRIGADPNDLLREARRVA